MNDSKKQKQVAEFLKVYEELYPLISHPSYFDNWAEDALELWELQCPNDPEGEIILEAALDFRKEFHNASLIAKKAPLRKPASGEQGGWSSNIMTTSTTCS